MRAHTIGDDTLVDVRLTLPTLLGGSIVGYWIATTASTTFHKAIKAIVASVYDQPRPSSHEAAGRRTSSLNG